MILKLAMLEGVSLWAAICGPILVWTTPAAASWTDGAIALAKALAIALCCIVSFYYNDLYDLRIVRTFGEFAARLFNAFGVTFILLAVLYTMFPAIRISSQPFLGSLLIILAIVLSLRAVLSVVVRRKPFPHLVLVLGASPLASTLIREIRSRPYLGYDIVGVELGRG